MTDVKRPEFRFLAGETLDSIRDRKKKPVDAIPTPIPTWNRLCGEEGAGRGLAKTWTVVVGGMPGAGKSYLALNLAAHAVRQGRKVGAINFEMSMAGYATRYLSVLTNTPKDMIGWGEDEFDEATWEQVKDEVDRIYSDTGGGLITNDATVFTIGHIHKAYEAFAKAGVDMVIVDYVQLVKTHGSGSDLGGQAEQVAEALRVNSHKHGMVTIALSQINRAGSGTMERQPRMTDLYGGTYWEANANQVVLLDHTTKRKDMNAQATRTKLIVDKNRHGPDFVEIPMKQVWGTMTIAEDTDMEDELDKVLDGAPPGTTEQKREAPDMDDMDWFE